MSTRDVPTVFIVDDDKDVRESLQELLESVGVQSKSFETAKEFLSSPRNDQPSCLILDVRLRGNAKRSFIKARKLWFSYIYLKQFTEPSSRLPLSE